MESKAKKIIIIAPAHDELDHRVQRSIKLLSLYFDEVIVYFEKHLSSSLQPQNRKVRYVYFSINKNPINLLFLNTSFIREKDLHNCNAFYIHEPGLLGLFLARSLNNKFQNKSIVYDYHDWIPWEISYQLYKTHLPTFLISIIGFFIRVFLKMFFYKIRLKAIIGISSRQIDSLVSFLQLQKIESISVPNTRIKIPDIVQVEKKNLDFLWVGNITPGRNLELIDNYIRRLNLNRHRKVKLAYIGKPFHSLMGNYDPSSSEYLGSFSNDTDIISKINNHPYVGIFLGWNDVNNTDINSIASVNKIYSYINIGIPFLISSKLTNMIETLRIPERMIVADFNDFQLKFLEIEDNYELYQSMVFDLKKQIKWDFEVELGLKKFYQKCYEN
jgi:hypothetical protein